MPKVRNEQMSWREFFHRLGALEENTPLIRLTKIRLETDNDIVKNWPDEYKSIRNEWQMRKLALMDDEDFERHKKIVNDRLARFFESCAN